MMAFGGQKGWRSALVAGLLAGTAPGAWAADLVTAPKELPAAAAAPTSTPIDFTFGSRVQSDYNFRGISQSNHDPSVQSYFEMQLLDNLFYAGIATYRTDLATRPPMEMDLTAGIRPKLGPFTFDFGVINYFYPHERQLIDGFGVIWTPRNTDFTEVAGKVSYTYADVLTLGANVFYAWDWLGTGAEGTYFSGTAKYLLPSPFPSGFAISGELGRYEFGGRVSGYLGGFALPDYTYWNAGVSYTYKAATLDLRYHDTDLKSSDCFLLTADPRGIASGSGRSNWCKAAFVATLSLDFTASTFLENIPFISPPK
jgi:uncharacterized protein (TIGR02001 family)